MKNCGKRGLAQASPGLPGRDVPVPAFRSASRGTVIILTLGLIVILGMLGATFLIISHLDRKQSEALAAKAPADPIAGGIVEQLRKQLAEDLYIGASGPYGNYGAVTDPQKWRRFVDYASTDIDSWLQDDSGDTEVRNAEGDEYHYSVSLIDTGGLINLNTAASPNDNIMTLPGTTRPVSVDLKGFLDQFSLTLYDNFFHPERWPTFSGLPAIRNNLAVFSSESAERLLYPETASGHGYLPFAIGDEMHLRWSAINSTNPPTATGRLYEVFRNYSAIHDTYADYLTTFNCSRSLVRHPNSNDPDLAIVTNTLAERVFLRPKLGLDVSNEGERNALYRQVFAMLSKLSLATSDTKCKRMAAHFVANLWAYQTAGTSGWPWGFKPKMPDGIAYEDFAAYGVIPQPVITEAYARHVQESDFGEEDNKWFAAVEVFNPYGVSLAHAGLQYKLPGLDIDAPDAGQRDVYYNYGGYGSLADVAADTGIPLADLNTWTRIDDSAFTFYGENTIKLTLGDASLDVVIDEVSSSDIGHVAESPGDGTETSNARRDDQTSPDLARYNAASYDLTPGFRSLGSANNLAGPPTVPETVAYGVPIVRKGADIMDLAECLQIYLAGHYKDDTSPWVPFTKTIVDAADTVSPLFEARIARGRLDVHPININYGGYSPGDYPDVPAGSLLSEFFTLVPPDDTRPDDPDDTRIYGRININTAPKEVLRRLPWPDSLLSVDLRNTKNQPTWDLIGLLADCIIAYRDKTAVAKDTWHLFDTSGTWIDVMDFQCDYSNRSSAMLGAGISGLRAQAASNIEGFLTPGEIAIPLADFADELMETLGIANLRQQEWYLETRDSLYRPISNLITVNSDVYAATIEVQLRDAGATTPKQTWNYITVLDRSNCRAVGDLPAVLLFSEVK